MAMVRPSQDLNNALGMGVDMCIIKWEAAEQDPEGVKALITSGNLGAARAKADSEIGMISILQQNMGTLSVTVIHTEMELNNIMLNTGHLWNQHHTHALDNFMRGIGPMHLDLRVRFVLVMAHTGKIWTRWNWFWRDP